MALPSMLPSVDTREATIRKLRVPFVTRIPCRWTSSGNNGSASESLFWT